MSPAGRPPLSGSTKGKFIQIRVTDEEKAVLDDAAAASGQHTGPWLRDLGFAAAEEIAAQQAAAKPAPKKAAKKKA